MNRSKMIHALKKEKGVWDVIIIGGGATGLGAAVDAASRGYKTLLLEMNDFAKGTSSRSTKLVHGGVRYLQQGDIPLVLEALKERGLLLKNAPHVTRDRTFIVPYYKWWQGPYYWTGLKLYDILSGKRRLGTSKYLSPKKTLKAIPTLRPQGLKGGILYHDGQFDDTRLAVNLAQTSADEGGTLINYMKVTGFLKTSQKIQGVQAEDRLSGETYELKGRAVINATGVFTDQLLKMDDSEAKPVIKPSQGIHIVMDRHFLPGDGGMMIPKTSDGRVLFALPWHDKVMIGTTDTPVDNAALEPEALDGEIEYILEHIGRYLSKSPVRSDVQSVFAGLRPLVKEGDSDDTAAISRNHSIMVSSSGLVTIAGGKWTTYRKMAEDVIDRAVRAADLEKKKCRTESLRIHGWAENNSTDDALHIYGSDQKEIEKIISKNPQLSERLHPRLPYKKAEVVWAVRNEMAMTVEDFNARRTRALFLDAEASIEMAPEVARLMAEEAGHDDQWIKSQVDAYKEVAEKYQVS
jgi:glycerol-3-phosphate dehydrogenase